MTDIDKIVEQQFEKQHEVLDNLRGIYGDKFADCVVQASTTIIVLYMTKRDMPEPLQDMFDHAAECVLRTEWKDSGHPDIKDFTDAIRALTQHIHVRVNE